MGLLPDKILEEAEINAFIDRTNSTAKEIVSDSKFEIPNPNLFGLGLLTKLQIRIAEKSLASFLAPIFLGKKSLNEGIDGIREALVSIKTLFSNPIQFLLDEGVNSTLEDFPFPIRLIADSSNGPSADSLNRLKNLIDNATPDSIDSVLERYGYELVFSNSNNPLSGQITTSASFLSLIKQIKISSISENSELNFALPTLRVGDELDLSDESGVGSFRVTSIRRIKGDPDYYELQLTRISISAESNPSSGSSRVPGFVNSEIRTSRRLALRDFTKDGSLVIPFSILGLPFLSRISLSIGDFSNISPDSSTAKYIQELERETDSKFSNLLSGILEGDFPNLDFKKIQSSSDNSETQKERKKEDMVAFARLIQIGAENPFFLIQILLNFLKLLLLPVQIFLGSIPGLSQKITDPVSLIQIIIQGITNPLKLLCDLVSESVLQSLEPYISPAITPIMPYSEAKQDPIDPRRGLKPLISDMVCGQFNKGLERYSPNKDFFDSVRSQLSEGAQPDEIPLSFPYDFIGELKIPDAGQLTANSNNIDEIIKIRVSYETGTVVNVLAPLVDVSVGETINLFVGEKFQNFRITYKKIETKYIEYGVLKQTPQDIEISEPERILRGINSDRFKSQLTVNNPNKTSLFILEKYLPFKLIAIWESIKGIIAIFGALASQIPSLLPAILRSLLGLKSRTSEEGSIDSLKETLDLVSRSWIYEATIKDFATPKFNEALRETVDSLLYKGDNTIETFFYDLNAELKDLGLDTAVFKDKLSTDNLGGSDLGKDFLYNRKVGDDYKFSTSMPTKNSSYYGVVKVNDLGLSTKVLLGILFRLRDLDYFSSDNINISEIELDIKGFNPEGKEITIYSGSIKNALVKYKLTNQGFSDSLPLIDLRIGINRELWFIRTYLLPSLKK